MTMKRPAVMMLALGFFLLLAACSSPDPETAESDFRSRFHEQVRKVDLGTVSANPQGSDGTFAYFAVKFRYTISGSDIHIPNSWASLNKGAGTHSATAVMTYERSGSADWILKEILISEES